MYRSSLRTTRTILSFALLSLGACSDESPTSPSPDPMLSRGSATADLAASVAICPTDESHRVRGVIGPDGGSLEVAGHRLTVPSGVLTEPTTFSLYAPAGRQVRLELSAGGAPHYRFQAPVAVTISYERCRRQRSPVPPASAWYLDETPRGVRVERMGGRDDRIERAVTFQTTHFSTYVVAY
jgi:hypothetical protein